MRQSEAIRILDQLRYWAISTHEHDERACDYMEKHFDRALAGNINLNGDPEQESQATAPSAR